MTASPHKNSDTRFATPEEAWAAGMAGQYKKALGEAGGDFRTASEKSGVPISVVVTAAISLGLVEELDQLARKAGNKNASLAKVWLEEETKALTHTEPTKPVQEVDTWSTEKGIRYREALKMQRNKGNYRTAAKIANVDVKDVSDWATISIRSDELVKIATDAGNPDAVGALQKLVLEQQLAQITHRR